MTDFKKSAEKYKEIDFHCNHINGYYLENVNNLNIQNYSIVINIGVVPAVIKGQPVKSIAPQKSTILQNTVIVSAANLIIVEVNERENLGSIIFRKGWKSAFELFGKPLKRVPLWRSPVEKVGKIKLDPYLLTESDVNVGSSVTSNQKLPYTVKVNLWFATEKTDCAIHNQHDFIEYHTQIIGIGRMQKFRSKFKDMLYEDQIMAEGNTHNIFCNTDENQNYHYPWHQYYSDTDCVWLVVELHPQ